MGTRAMKMVLMDSQWWAAASKNSRDWTMVRPGCTQRRGQTVQNRSNQHVGRARKQAAGAGPWPGRAVHGATEMDSKAHPTAAGGSTSRPECKQELQARHGASKLYAPARRQPHQAHGVGLHQDLQRAHGPANKRRSTGRLGYGTSWAHASHSTCEQPSSAHGRRHGPPASQSSGAACAALSTHQRRRCVNTPAMSSGAMPKDRRSLRYIVAMPALIKDMAATRGRRRMGPEGGVWKAAAAGDSRGKGSPGCTAAMLR